MFTGKTPRGMPGCRSTCATRSVAAEKRARKWASVRVMEASERSTKNPQFFNDDVAPTKQAQRHAITDASSAFASIKAQEKKLRDAFSTNECPLRIGNAPTYSSGLQHAYQSTPTAAVSLFPLLAYPREGAAPGEDTEPALTEISLSRLIREEPARRAAAEAAAAAEAEE